MSILRLWELVVEHAPQICLTVVIVQPILKWALASWDRRQVIVEVPYDMADFKLILVSIFLLSIYQVVDRLSRKIETLPGDESKIIMNRNESDYYEIWQETKKHRRIKIEAIGHSFNTLWFNFLKKFLTDALQRMAAFDKIEIVLISTRLNPPSFQDIETFIAKMDETAAKKVKFTVRSIESSTMFFTGLSVNRSSLWLSIREPHAFSKANEHVREWRRESSSSAAKMLAWYGGIVDHLLRESSPDRLAKTGSRRQTEGLGVPVSADPKA